MRKHTSTECKSEFNAWVLTEDPDWRSFSTFRREDDSGLCPANRSRASTDLISYGRIAREDSKRGASRQVVGLFFFVCQCLWRGRNRLSLLLSCRVYLFQVAVLHSLRRWRALATMIRRLCADDRSLRPLSLVAPRPFLTIVSKSLGPSWISNAEFIF